MASAVHPDLQSARADLAFMRALAEDRDPLPALYGAHLLALGLCFGPALLVTAAAFAGVAGIPENWTNWAWLPAGIVYTPLLLMILARSGRGTRGGPAMRAVWFVWAVSAAVLFTFLAGLIAAGGGPVMVMWLPALLAVYGGAWMLKAFVRGARWHGLVATGCFLTSIAAAAVAPNEAAQFALAGAALLVFLALPGLAIMLAARRRA